MAEILETIKIFFLNLFGDAYLATFVLSMIPIIELRGGLPFCYAMLLSDGVPKGIAIINSFWVSMLGSAAVSPILLLLFIPILNFLKSTKLFKSLATKIENHFHKKTVKLQKKADGKTSELCSDIEKKKRLDFFTAIGLFTFVAIPLPGTGVWTGSAVAALMGVKFKKAIVPILLGNFVAAICVALISFLAI